MSETCSDCNLPIRQRQEVVTCFCCSKQHHRTCNTGITRQQYRDMKRANIPIQFCCSACIQLVPDAESTRLSTGDLTIPYGVTLHDQTVSAPDPDQSSFDLTDRHTFSIQPEVQEASLTDDSIDPVHARDTEAVVTFQVVESGTQRAKRKLVSSDGYTFTCKRQNTTSTEWRCSLCNKRLTCPVTVLQSGDKFTVNQTHLHAAQPGILSTVLIQKEVRSKSREEMFEPAPCVVDEILEEHVDTRQPEAARPKYNNLTRNCNRIRQKLRPADPSDMDFNLDTGFLTKYLKGQTFFRADVQVKQRRHLIFSTDRQLELLRKAKTWYIDGTFKVVKDPFYQLLSIHAFVRAGDDMKQLPLVFCVMSGKNKKDYKKVFKTILDLLPVAPEVKSFVVDFESGLWRALQSLFNNPDIKGCAFHWGQAVWRKVQEKGLQTAYTEYDDVYKFLRKVFALPFLPADHILDAFT